MLMTACASLPSSFSSHCAWLPRPTGTLCATRSEEHTSELQSHSDLHSFPTRRSSDLTFHGLNAHDGLRELAVELLVPLRVASEADGNAVRDHFKDSADGVAGFESGIH